MASEIRFKPQWRLRKGTTLITPGSTERRRMLSNSPDIHCTKAKGK
jgi:hypothetical protein